MHRYRLTFLGGLAAGFVLGARAGRERYEQIKRLGRHVAESPAAQQAAGAVQAKAAGLANAARQKITDELHDRVPKVAETARGKVGGRAPGRWRRNGSSRQPDAPGSDATSADGSSPAASGPRAAPS